MIEKLKILLGIEDNSKDYVLQLTIDIVKDMVLNYCNIKEIPSSLESVVIAMCIDKYRAESYGSQTVEGKVSSISEGEVSVAYTYDNNSADILKDYKSQLNLYRKVGF